MKDKARQILIRRRISKREDNYPLQHQNAKRVGVNMTQQSSALAGENPCSHHCSARKLTVGKSSFFELNLPHRVVMRLKHCSDDLGGRAEDTSNKCKLDSSEEDQPCS